MVGGINIFVHAGSGKACRRGKKRIAVTSTRFTEDHPQSSFSYHNIVWDSTPRNTIELLRDNILYRNIVFEALEYYEYPLQ